jgi:hypothetical protein
MDRTMPDSRFPHSATADRNPHFGILALQMEFESAFAACRKAAGPPLRKLFDDRGYQDRRTEIIDLWGKIRSTDGVEILINLLKQHDRFRAQQDLAKGWWERDPESDVGKRRRSAMEETYHAVWSLAAIGDPRAREALQLTLKRWQAIDVPPPEKGGPRSIVEACDRALELLGQPKRGR